MTKQTQKLQALLKKQIGKGNIHSIVAALQSYDRSIDFAGAAGIADAQTSETMTPDTPYFIGSVTKMYTAAIVLRLHEEKRINLDEPISQYLLASLTSGIHIYKDKDYSDQIKVVELVNQSSGLADFEAEKPQGGKSVMDDLKAGHDRSIDIVEAIEITRSLSPHFPPHTPGKAYYSNLNYRLLGEIIESVTEQSMAANFVEMVFKPLGFQHTYLYDCAAPNFKDAPATIYLKGKPAYVPKYLSSNTADGGIVSTAPECIIFLRAFFEGRLFHKTFLKKMMTWNPIFFPLRYGYGLMYFRLPRFVWPTPLPEFIGHSGSTGSFAFVCPLRSLYLAGTVNQIASPAKPFFLMIDLVHRVS
ncbi:MAG: class A beta-lactamase-related serine hydrolase [Chloroflexi bacterium]|nr:MAG: class A beta-lactamase-related serine hydrolase [Chloroflexota bacterium]